MFPLAAGAIGAGLLGGLFGGGGGGGESATTTNSVPPEFAPLAQWGAQRGMQIGNMPFQGVPFNPTAGFNPYQFQGFDMTLNRANQASPLLGNMESSLADTLGGKYLDSNPYIDNMVTQNMDEWQSRLGSQGLGSGSFGNANLTQSVTQGAQNAANNLRFQNYDAERNRMMSAASMAPQAYMAGYMPAQQVMGVGNTMQQQSQNQLNSMMQEWQRSQDWPFRTFQSAMSPFSQNIGSQQTTTQPGTNPVSGLLGGALGAAQLFRLFGG